MSAPQTVPQTVPRMLHTMIRTKNLDASIDFYTRLLGMQVLRRTDVPGGKYTLAFVGYGDETRSRGQSGTTV